MTQKQLNLHRVISAVLLGAVAILIFYLSSQCADDSSETSGSVVSWLHDILKIDLPDGTIRTVAHFCEFASLGFLVLNMLHSYRDNFSPVISVAISFLYAVSDEIHQIFVPGRACQLVDMAVDLLGITAGTLAFLILLKIIRTK